MFDEDPKRWRLIAEGFTTSGRALEIATAVFPQQFVLLAGVLVSVLPKVGQASGRNGGGWGLGRRIWLCLQLHCYLAERELIGVCCIIVTCRAEVLPAESKHDAQLQPTKAHSHQLQIAAGFCTKFIDPSSCM